jgi:membrane-associated protease RseP (regulator of RpoE activity)
VLHGTTDEPAAGLRLANACRSRISLILFPVHPVQRALSMRRLSQIFLVLLAFIAWDGITLPIAAQERGYLGVDIKNLNDERARELHLDAIAGSLVVGIKRDSPAERVGLQADDVILALDDIPMENTDAVVRFIGAKPPGSKLKIAIWRSAHRLELLATLAPFPRALGDPPSP